MNPHITQKSKQQTKKTLWFLFKKKAGIDLEMHQRFIIHSTSQPLIQYQPTNILATQVDFEVKDPSRMGFPRRNGTGRPNRLTT